MCYDWPVKKSYCQFANQRLKGNSKHISGTEFTQSPLVDKNKDHGTASQTSLTKIKLCLPHWLQVA